MSNSALHFYAALAAAAAVVGGAGTFALVSRGGGHDAGNCLVDGPAPAHTLLLVDTTDPATVTEAQRLVQTADTAAADLPRYGRMTVMLVRPEAPWEPQQIVSLCSPGRGSAVNPLTETPELVEAAWRRDFVARLRTAAERLTTLPKSEESPLLQSAAAVAGRRDFAPGQPRRTLIFFTDGLQHAIGGYSHYTAADPKAAYQHSPLASELDPDFGGATVEIEYLRRPGGALYQGVRHKAFWRWWFTSHGARAVRFHDS